MKSERWWRKFESKKFRDAYVSSHIPSCVALQISEMRRQRGWTQADLARLTGMKQSQISRIENPNETSVNVRTLCRVASAFDVAVSVRFVGFGNTDAWNEFPCQDAITPHAFSDERRTHTARISENTEKPPVDAESE